MQERTTGAIALRPTGNAQGAYFFMSITTGLRLKLQSFTLLPLPHNVINVVHPLRTTIQKVSIFGKIKVRGCEEGRKLRKYLTKDNTSAPTMAAEALSLTFLINAMDNQKVATVNIPG